MLKRLMVFFIGVVSAGSLRAQAGGGFAELGDVFSAYVAAMKTNDDAALMDFCLALTPDEATTQYMDAHHLCYRGIPCQMNQHGVSRQYLADEFFDGLVRLRDGLRAAGLLEGLAHPDTTAYRWEYELFVNLKAPGTDNVVDQMNFSLSMARYAALEAEARAGGVTLDALLLAGKNGEVVTVRGTEDTMHLTSGDYHIHYSMGELVCINTRWLLFTKPRPDYEVRGEGG